MPKISSYSSGGALVGTDQLVIARGGQNYSVFGGFFDLPDGFMMGGRLSVTVAANAITVAVKTTAGNNPSVNEPVFVKLEGTWYVITAALSVTRAAATNWFYAGSSELATKEIDYFAYIGRNATDGITIGFARIPYGRRYDSFSTTSNDEKYCAISVTTNAAAADPYNVVGRFAAILSAGAGYTWSVPAFTAINLVQKPIFETRVLSWTPTLTGFSVNPTVTTYSYKVLLTMCFVFVRQAGSGTSNATNFVMTGPFLSSLAMHIALGETFDSGSAATTPGKVTIGAAGAAPPTFTLFKDMASGAWTNSGGKRATFAIAFPLSGSL